MPRLELGPHRIKPRSDSPRRFCFRAGRLVLPGGRPVFPEVPAKTPEQVLTGHGLKANPVRVLDTEKDVTLVSWRR